MKSFLKEKLLFFSSNTFTYFFSISIFIPFCIVAWLVWTGSVSFWYDNARDLLSAWDNITNPTLIGPRSGIEGIFYGPYWTWLLSIALLVSKDPRVAYFLAGIVPYLIIFPLVFYLYKFVLNKIAIIALWIFFIFNIGSSYAANLWNPHIAPLLLLALILVLIKHDFNSFILKKALVALLAGIISGLLLNFHISLGAGVIFGLILFLLSKALISLKKRKILSFFANVIFIGLGLILVYLPFIVFEVRNGFGQIKRFIEILGGSGGTEHIEGLSRVLIIDLFFSRGAKLLGVSLPIFLCLLFLVILVLVFLILKRIIKVNKDERSLLWVLACLTTGILGIYLSANNPVWSYHFIGVEVIFLLFLALVITKVKLLKYPFMMAAGVVLILGIINFIQILGNNSITGNTLKAKKEIAETIIRDSNENSFSFYAYSPSIYMYEYAYLFKWLNGINIPFDPGENQGNNDIIYLVVPVEKSAEIEDFINFRSGGEVYQTADSWVSNDMMVIKQKKHE